MNKIILSIIAVLTVSLGTVAGVLAHEEPSVMQAQTQGDAPRSETTAAQRTERFRSRVLAELDRRHRMLSSLRQRMEQSGKLSTAHKSAFVAQLETEIKAIEAIKLEVTAAGSTDALQTQLAKLSAQFKTYNLVVPKANLLRMIDRQLVLIEKLEALAVKFQTRIDAAKQAGENTAKQEQALTELRQFLGNARQRTQSAELEVATLAPTSIANDRKVLNGHYGDLKNAHKELMAAVRKAREILQLLAKN